MSTEPNFEGEEMRLPTTTQKEVAKETPAEPKGIILLTLVVALVLILVGLVYWYRITHQVIIVDDNKAERPAVETNREPETTTATAQVDTLGVQSTSDEISAIEADLESTDLQNLDAELLQIEAELQSVE